MTPKTSPKKRVAIRATTVLATSRAKRAIADSGDARLHARVLDALLVATSVDDRGRQLGPMVLTEMRCCSSSPKYNDLAVLVFNPCATSHE